MDFESIRAFLAVVDTGSISAAANVLFTSQSSVSRKIASIERELGITLLNRSKGQSSITLTAAGEAFMYNARQMDVVYKDMESLSHNPVRQFLSIGANEMSQVLFLNAFCPSFIDRHPEICLSIHSYHSSTIHQRLRSHLIDIGYVSVLQEKENEKTTLMLNLPLVLVTNRESPYYAGMNITELPADKEVYLRYSAQYEYWHNHIFPGKQYAVRVSRELMMVSYLQKEKRWGLATRASANVMSKMSDNIVIYPVEDIPNTVKIYEVIQNDIRPGRLQASEIFRKELDEYIKNAGL